ncbi:5-methylcytosine restriction system specificity protein McrC [Lacinutrix himadriensis]|uniref:5-methylcytosine restriction system specificity protein McrC n=1 Tax=Lacinutrix himadriensis TaxID=641549 RepID=UPI0006E1A78C|nr:hypothetical protein [Lacinutrix himadriensis]
MIILREHFGNKFKAKDRYLLSNRNESISNQIFVNGTIEKLFSDKTDTFCYKLSQSEDGKCQFETGYYIGVDWIGETNVPIYVQPKVNNEDIEIDYLFMLFEALEEPKNFEHLEALYTIDFDAPLLEIEQYQDQLTPLLLLEYLQILKKIVNKGLKKSYYKVTRNLNAKVKGKILVNGTLKLNHSKQKMLYTVCQYEEFGYNSIENKILKKALLFTRSALDKIKTNSKINLNEVFNYISPVFENIEEEVDIRVLKSSKPNPMFKEYTQALKLAKLILKKYGYNISNTKANKIKTPPFWIDMPKLFELYVFKKLREEFRGKGEVVYHQKVNRQEPDYIIKSEDNTCKFVVDAKYKPYYEDQEIQMRDARQVSGYARMEKMYKLLGEEDSNKVLDCLIIYSHQNQNKNIKKDNLHLDAYKHYVNFYRYGIKLPEILSRIPKSS